MSGAEAPNLDRALGLVDGYALSPHEQRIHDAIEANERRERRESYRRAGGSKRRPLRSFMTDAEKREARDAHAARIHAAVDELRTQAGFARWVESMALNPDLTPMNAALVALQSPGEIVGTAAGWKRQGYRVRKGERAAGRITARGFWPLAYFTAEQAGATDITAMAEAEPFEPPTDLDTLRDALSARLSAGERPRLALAAVADCIAPQLALAA